MENHTLVIWDQSRSLDYINIRSNAINLIKDAAEFELFKAEHEQPKYQEVYILADLQWDNVTAICFGYVVLEYLLNNYQNLLNVESPEFKLSTFSIFDKRILYELCTNVGGKDYRRFVAAFPPELISINEKSMTARKISQVTFDFLRRSTCDILFILNSLLHKIRYCFMPEHDPIGKRYLSFKEELLSKETILLESSPKLLHIQTVLYEAKTVDVLAQETSDARNFCNSLESRLIHDKRYYSNSFGLIDSEDEPFKGLSFMVLEDDVEMNAIVEKWLTDLGAIVKSFYSGSEAYDALVSYKENNDKNPYDCLFSDLELKDKDGIFYDRKQGMDVVQFNTENFPTVPICLLTGAPKDTVSGLISAKVFATLYKNEGKVIPLYTGNEDFIKNLKEEIQANKNQYGPRAGRHNQPKHPEYDRIYIKFYYSLPRPNRNALWVEVYEEVIRCLENKPNHRQNPINIISGAVVKSPPKYDLYELVRSLLINRLIVIALLLVRWKGNNRSKGNLYSKDLAMHFNDIDSKSPKSFLFDNLGFRIPNLVLNDHFNLDPKKEDCIEIINFTNFKVEEFFDRETQLIKNYKENFSSNDFVSFLKAQL